MDKQVKSLEILHRRVKRIIADCSKMTPKEYERARNYISSRHEVSLPYKQPPAIAPQVVTDVTSEDK